MTGVSAQDFYDHHYAPNNAILIVAGDVTPDQMRTLAQSEYGKVAAREIPPRAEFAEPPRIAETRITAQRPDARVPIFTRTYRVPSYAQAAPGQAEGLELLSQIMGGDQTAALYRILVEQKKLASDAGCNYDGFTRDAAEFSVYGVPRPGVSLETLEKAMDQVIQGFTAAPASAADLTRAKTQLVASVTYRRDSQMAMATAYGTALMIGLTVDDVNEWPSRIRGGGRQWRAQGGPEPQQARRGDRLSASDASRADARPEREALPSHEENSRPAGSDPAGAAPGAGGRYQNLDLGKNAQVWFAEDHTVPIVAVVAALPAGSAYDPGAKPGLAAFAAALMDEGAGNMDSKAFHEALADHAIQFRASVERDYLVISVVSLTENLPEAMRLMQTALTHPRFDAEAVSAGAHPDHAIPGAGRKRAAQRGAAGLCHAISSTAILMAIPPTAMPPASQAITADDLRGFAKSHWVRGGIKISVAGDITAAAATKLIGDTFKPVPETSAAAAAADRQAGPARRACHRHAGAAGHRDFRPAGHHAPGPGFHCPAMSPIIFWAAADFPRA